MDKSELSKKEIKKLKHEAIERAKIKLKAYVAEKEANMGGMQLMPRARTHIYMVMLHDIYREMGLDFLIEDSPS